MSQRIKDVLQRPPAHLIRIDAKVDQQLIEPDPTTSHAEIENAKSEVRHDQECRGH
jgi:hypothetical protein